MSRFLAKPLPKVIHLEPSCKREPILCVLAIVLVLLTTAQVTAERFHMVFPKDPYKGLFVYEMIEKVEQDLLYERHDLATWAAELHEKKPQNVKEAFVKLDVMLRTGMDGYALQAATELKALYSELTPAEVEKNNCFLTNTLLYQDNLLDFPKTAVALLEITPERITGIGSTTMMKWVDQLSQDWGKEKLDQWLVTMQSRSTKKRELIPAICKTESWSLPLGKKLDPWRLPHRDRPGCFFLWLRLKIRKNVDEQTELLKSLEQVARDNPDDIFKMLDFIFAWQVIYSCDLSHGFLEFEKLEKYAGPDLSWIAEVSHPKTSLDAYYLGMELYESGQWKPAKVFLQKAKALWETMADKKKSADGPEERVIETTDCSLDEKKKFFRPYPVVIDRMIYLCDKEGNASKWSDRKPLTAELMEKKEEALLQEEKKSADKPDYWYRRAVFYASEKIDENGKPRELFKAEEALKKGLALTDPISKPKRKKPDRRTRVSLLKTYANLLHGQKRHEELFRILLYEMEHSPESPFPLELSYSGFLDELSPFSKPNEPIVWKWLERRPKWKCCGETDYLDWMAKTIKERVQEEWGNTVNAEAPEPVYQFVERIEAMSKKGDVSRMLYCITLLDGNDSLGIGKNLDRLFPLILDRLKKKDLNEKDRELLWSHYFHLHTQDGRLEAAEKILQNPDFPARHQTMFYGMISTAMKKGNKGIAMKNWRRLVNCNLKGSSQFHLNATMRRNGLGDKIDAYYADVKKKLPDFVPPEKK